MTSRPPVAERRDRFVPWALAGVLLLAAAIRLWEAGRTRLWFDELFTLAVAQLPLDEAVSLMRRDMHPPLYFLAVWGWRALVGEGDVALRLVSLVAAVAGVAAVYGVAREAFGARAGLLAALLVALHRSHVFYSQELRNYAWFWLFASVAAWAALRWLRRGRPADAIAYGAATALALWTHYLAIPVIGTLATAVFVAALRQGRGAAAWVAVNLGALALFAPQLPTLLGQMAENRADHWVPPSTVADLVEWARQLAFGAPYLAAIGVVLVAMAFRNPATRGAASVLLATIVVPVAASWWLTREGARLFTTAYMLFAIPFFCSLVAGGMVQLTPPLVRRAVIGAVVLMVARSMALKQPLVEPTELARAAATLAPRLRPGDVVYHAEAHSYLFFRHYHAREARQVLLLSDPELPYYEGARLIGAAERAMLAEFDRRRAEGGRWFGVRAQHVGMDGDSVAARFQGAAGSPVMEGAVVSVWDGTNK